MNKVNKKVILQDVRCSFVYLDKPNKHGKYSVQPLIEKGSENYKKIMRIQKEVLQEAFGEEAWAKKGKYKLPVRDGDADPELGGEPRDGEEYRNVVFFNANSGIKKPGVVNPRNEPADLNDMEELGYSGAYFHVSLNAYPFPGEDGSKPGVAIGLSNVMLRRKGERLDGSVAATSEFAEFAVSNSSDDFDDDI